MSSPESTGNNFQTPNSSPDTTEADLRLLERALDQFGHALNETAQNFDEYCDHFNELDEVFLPQNQVSQNIAQANHSSQTQEQGRSQVSATLVGQLVRQFEAGSHTYQAHNQYFTSGLPLRRTQRSLTISWRSSQSSHRRHSSFSMPGSLGGDTPNSAIMSGTEHDAETDQATANTHASGEWKRFERYARGQLTQAQYQVNKIKDKLANKNAPCTKADLNAHNIQIHRWQSKLADIQYDTKNLAIADEVCGNLSYDLSADSEDLVAELVHIAANIEEMLSSLKEDSSSNKALIQNLEAIKDNLQSGHAPSLELPTYEGDTTQFGTFKPTFHQILLALNIPKELWASHLVASLKGPAKDYIGPGERWFNRYDELWQALEDKYANSWNLNYITISKFFAKTLTSEDPEEIKAFIHDQILNLENVKLLKLTSENIGIIYMMHQLPVATRDIMRNAMKLRKPQSEITDFTVEEFRKIFNETVGTITDEESKNVSTFSFKNQVEAHPRQGKRYDKNSNLVSYTKQDADKFHSVPQAEAYVTNSARRQSPDLRDYHHNHHSSDRGENYETPRHDRSYYSRPDHHETSLTSHHGKYSHRDSRSPARGHYRSTSRERRGKVRSPSRTYYRSPSRERRRDTRSPSRNSYRDYNQEGRSGGRSPNREYSRNNQGGRTDDVNNREYQRSTEQRYDGRREDDRQYNRRDQNYSTEQRGRGRGRGRGNNRGRGGANQGNGFVRQCFVCLDDSRFGHSSFICPKYPTAALKRQHLESTNRCNCCAHPIHHGNCTPRAVCIIHNEPHFTYLCGGTPHPGKNSPDRAT